MSRPLLLSWSGGKDAAWALHTLRLRGDHDVIGLVTTLTEGYERISMQGIRRDILHAQARACGLPVIEAWMPQRASNEVYRRTFADALARAQAHWPALRDIAFGDLFLADIRAYREALCAELGWTPHFPIFAPGCGADADRARAHTGAVAREMMAAGLRADLVCVDTEQLDGAFSGRAFDAELLRDLPPACDPCGENGEFHTLVHAGPMFRAQIAIGRGEAVLREARFLYTDFRLADG